MEGYVPGDKDAFGVEVEEFVTFGAEGIAEEYGFSGAGIEFLSGLREGGREAEASEGLHVRV